MNADKQNTIVDETIKPFIPAHETLAEITVKGLILSIVLASVMAAANIYLGLKVGITVTGSIPSAIIAMAVLRLFSESNILENNIVQTTASAGYSLASGTIFTIPAMLILKLWFEFDYWSTFFIIVTGGLLGVLFSIPLRRTFINAPSLKFPEGVAIGNVLKLSTQVSGSITRMLQGTAIGGSISLCQNGLRILADSASYWAKFGTSVIGFGFGFDAAVIGAGYIVGVEVGISILVGAIISWLIGIPTVGFIYGLPESVTTLEGAGMTLWSQHIRFFGVGALLVGGMWAVFSLIDPIIQGIKSSFAAFKQRNSKQVVLRTEKDIPINYVLWGLAAIGAVMLLIFNHFLSNPALQLSDSLRWGIAILNTVYLLTAGFMFSAICCYLAGLVGSSSNPLSGLILASILSICLILLPVFSIELTLSDPDTLRAALGIAIVVATLIGTSSAVGQDNLQDLKAGQIVGATPWKQQVALMIGIITAAFIIPSVLELLFNAYGIGGAFPREGMDPSQMLAAPQAGLMASIATGVFAHNLPWGTISAGALVAIGCIFVDKHLRRYNLRLPVLAVGIGIYLPFSASISLTIGGLASYFIHHGSNKNENDEAHQIGQQKGISIACGLVAGASLMGIFLAIPAVILQSTEGLRIVPTSFTPIAEVLTMIVIALMFRWMYRVVNQ